jgi:CAAX prenyl protease-like protein
MRGAVHLNLRITSGNASAVCTHHRARIGHKKREEDARFTVNAVPNDIGIEPSLPDDRRAHDGCAIHDCRGVIIGNGVDNSPMSAQWVTPGVARVLPFAVFVAFIAFEAVAADRLRLSGMDTRWLYVARIVVVSFALAGLWRHYIELHSFAGMTARSAIAAVATGIIVFAVWICVDFAWARMGTPPGFDPTTGGGAQFAWQFLFFRLFGLAIIVPVMEELFWRSFLLRRLERHDFLAQDPARIGVRAGLICAALFALEHTLWFAGLIAGVAYVLVYVRGRNLWLAVISHATTNAALGGWIVFNRSWQLW